MKKFIILVLCLGLCLAICKTDSWGCGGVTSSGNVQGNNHNWTHIGTVKQGSVMRIHASGVVDFGCFACGCVDSAVAGVEGKSLVFVKLFDTLKQQIDAAKTLNPVEAVQKNINAMKSAFGSTHQPNFDQGGVWIKVLKKNGTPYIGTQLYYFWEHGNGINKHGLHINEDVDVYAKAHDGGKSPDSTKSYGDNHGAYTVRIESAVMQSAGGAASGAGAGASAAAHMAQPVGQVIGSSGGGASGAGGGAYGASGGTSGAGAGAAAGTHINVRSCTNCVGACAAGHTCIYINGACFLSCQ